MRIAANLPLRFTGQAKLFCGIRVRGKIALEFFFDSFEFLEVPVRRILYMAWRTPLQVGMSQIRLLNHPGGRGLVALLTRSGYYTRRASGGSSSQVLNEEKRAAAEAVYIKVHFHSLSQRALPETSYEHRSKPPDWRIHAISTARLFPVSAKHRQEHCDHSLQTNARVSRACSSIASINIKSLCWMMFLAESGAGKVGHAFAEGPVLNLTL